MHCYAADERKEDASELYTNVSSVYVEEDSGESHVRRDATFVDCRRELTQGSSIGLLCPVVI